jgi:hypothetical protein
VPQLAGGGLGRPLPGEAGLAWCAQRRISAARSSSTVVGCALHEAAGCKSWTLVLDRVALGLVQPATASCGLDAGGLGTAAGTCSREGELAPRPRAALSSGGGD